MKTLITFFLAATIFLITNDVFSQNYNGQFQEFFLGRQPSARAEAMGRGLSAVTGDALSYYYNPAGMASLKGLNVNASFAGPFYLLDEGSYNLLGASYKIEKYGTIGINRDYFTFGDDVIVTDEFGNSTGSYTPHVQNYRLNLSSEVIKDLFVGANLNLLQPRYSSGELTVGNETSGGNKDIFYFDLGVIKSFNMKSKNLVHGFNIGTSLINVNFAEYAPVDADQGDPLPVIFRLGASYNLSVDDKKISPKLKSYNVVANLEYEDLLNSKYYSGFHGGIEFTFLEVISLRAGYYTMENQTLSYDSLGFQRTGFDINEFTYGAGLNIPIRQLTNSKTPLEIKFDYVNLKQPATNSNKDDWDNFHVYTFIVNWIF